MAWECEQNEDVLGRNTYINTDLKGPLDTGDPVLLEFGNVFLGHGSWNQSFWAERDCTRGNNQAGPALSLSRMSVTIYRRGVIEVPPQQQPLYDPTTAPRYWPFCPRGPSGERSWRSGYGRNQQRP